MRAVLLGLVLFTLACGGGETPPAEAPPAEATPEPTPAPETPEPPAPTPAPVDTGGVPEGSLRGDAAAGAKVYGQFCATCHGAGGRGDGPAAVMEPKPADHTDPAYMGVLSDEHLYKVIDKGGAAVGKSPLMTPWGGVLNEQQIKDLVAHLRKLSNT